MSFGSSAFPSGTAPEMPALESALATRLKTVAPFLLGDQSGTLPSIDHLDPAAQAGLLLDVLVRSVKDDLAPDRLWLLLTSICAAYPTRDDIDQFRRTLELSDAHTAAVRVLDIAFPLAYGSGDLEAEIEVLHHRVLIDVDHSAKSDLHTGIQRVVRSVLPCWRDRESVVAAVWNAPRGGLRRLDPHESERVLSWAVAGPDRADDGDLGQPFTRSDRPVLLVPWKSVVMVIEVAEPEASRRLAALGAASGNSVVAVVHDMIPIVSAEMVPFDESAKYSEYLAGVKFASRLAADSAATAAEFTGFVSALATQGLRGPQVREIALGSAPTAASTRSASTSDKNILVVGSHEPRKNHLAVLHAAEVLWREGLEFTLTFIGGSGWGEAFPRRVRELQDSSRDVSVLRAASESDLEAAYSRADFTVFPSLHEGFGLPVTESLARGVPVITSNFGAPAELGSHGGALLIDSRDDGSLTEAMRRLLTDADLLHRLSSEARRRQVRTWSEYAEELWEWLVEPERRSLDPSGRKAAESGHAQAISG